MDKDINAIYGGIGTKLGDNMYCRALSTLNLNLEPPPCSIRLDKNSTDKCTEIDFTTKTSNP